MNKPKTTTASDLVTDAMVEAACIAWWTPEIWERRTEEQQDELRVWHRAAITAALEHSMLPRAVENLQRVVEASHAYESDSSLMAGMRMGCAIEACSTTLAVMKDQGANQ